MPLWNFLETVFKPVLLTLAVVVFGPLAVAITAVSIVLTSLWQFVVVPFATFLAGIFGPIITRIAGFFSGVFAGAVNIARSVLSTIWNSFLVPIGGYLQGGFSTALGIASGAWNALKSAVSTVGDVLSTVWNDFIKPVANTLRNAFSTAADVASSAWDAMGDAVSAVGDIISDIIGIIESAIDKIQQLGDFISDLPGAGVISDIAGALPSFARGGIIDEDMLAMLHKPEVVIPLDDPSRAFQLASQSGLLDLISAPTSGPAGSSFTPATAGGVGGIAINVENNFANTPTEAEAGAVGDIIGAHIVSEVLQLRGVRLEPSLV
jgi:hypothetical protein